MSKQFLPLLMEPASVTPVWLADGVDSLRALATRQKIPVQEFRDATRLAEDGEAPSAAVVVSTNVEWTRGVILALLRLHVRPVLIGTVPGEFGDEASGTLLNHRAGVEWFVRYFHGAGRDRIALVGANSASSNDVIKREAFLSVTEHLGLPCGASDVYPTDGDIAQPIDTFLSRAGRYDGAICANDYIAVRLLAQARRMGVRVPEDLFVSGFGDLFIGQCAEPSLTSARLDYREVGRQAFSIWRTLCENPRVCGVTVLVEHEIVCRGSTAHFDPANVAQLTRGASAETAAPPMGVVNREMRGLEHCLRGCDPLDWKILSALMTSESCEDICFSLYLSRGMLEYRLKKLYTAAGVRTRAQLEAVLCRYIPHIDALTPRL